jgi:hypothetical protein
MINHWDAVWYHYRHSDQLLPRDRIVTKFIIPGTTLAWNSFGARFQNWIPNLTIHENLLDQRPDAVNSFNNILALNVFELRYNSIAEYAHQLGHLCDNLLPGGRLILGINSIFINWNRTALSPEQAFAQLTLHMANNYQMQLTYQMLRPFITNSLNGDCFLIFDKTPIII